MRNLLNFFIKYHVLFLFLVLELLSLTFIIRYNNFHQVKFLNSSNQISGKVYEKAQSVREYFTLRKTNEKLALENALLRQSLQSMLASDIQRSVELNVGENRVKAISAKVINNSVNKQYNYLTLNRGSRHGVKPEMGIICSDGIVGVILNVTENYSTALSVLNGRWSVNAKLKSSNHFGPLRWEGKNPYLVILEEIPYHVKIADNEEVVTSGFSSMFPDGVSIGHVVKVEHREGDSFQKAWVQLSTDFKSLMYVEIIESVSKREQLQLEKLNSDE
ncbi:MAG: rod shape-determining protein MreC [Prolixibacteraceae bacterium]|nr:rod shape-determining protein MreC [Prolixibacteraceae bacterium]